MRTYSLAKTMMGKVHAIILMAVVVLVQPSCVQQVQRSDECKAFVKGLQAGWSLDPERKIFQINSQDGRRNQDFLVRIDDHLECLKGWTAKKVRRIFGEPSQIDGTRWKYWLVDSCLNDEFDKCDFLDLVVDDEKGLQSIRLSGQDLVD